MGIPSVDVSQVHCLQINLQHSRSATYSLMKVIDTDETDIVLVQEPYVYQNKIIGIDKSYRIFSAGQGRPRVAIIIPNKMDAMLINRVSNEDTVLLEIKQKPDTLRSQYVFRYRRTDRKQLSKNGQDPADSLRWKNLNSRGQQCALEDVARYQNKYKRQKDGRIPGKQPAIRN